MANTTFRKHGLEFVDHKLSAGQLEVSELAADARALVYGAPGSGKTTALKKLYLNQVKKRGLKAHNVLAITASRDAANLLRDELALANHGATAGPMARTLASFAFSILREAALKDGTRSPELINGSEQDRIIKQLLEQEVEAGLSADWPKHVREGVLSLSGFRAEVRELFTVCLERGVSPAELRSLGVAQGQQIWVAASNVFERYLEVLATPANDNRHDPSNLLSKANELLAEKPWAPFVADLKLVGTAENDLVHSRSNPPILEVAERGVPLARNRWEVERVPVILAISADLLRDFDRPFATDRLDDVLDC
jgi:superfamily I DNA/RNA helicase